MSPLFYYKQKKMGIAIYVCITFVRHNIIKSALQTIYDQQSARSTSSILNCSEASLGYRPLFTGGLCDFFFCFVQFLQADHLILGILYYCRNIVVPICRRFPERTTCICL